MFGQNSNTGSGTGFGGFGQQNNNSTGNSLFGQSTTSAFGANNNSSTQGFSMSPFNSNNTSTPNTSGTGLFGQPANTSSTFGGFGSANRSGGFGSAFGANTNNSSNTLGSTNGTTTGGLFGSSANNNTTTSTPRFGSFGGTSTGSAFGSGVGNNTATGTTPTTGGLFGSKPAGSLSFGGFGSTNTASNTSTTQPTSAFGFGSTSSPSVAQQPPQGTGTVPFEPFTEKDPTGNTTSIYQAITCMPAYQKFSFEELREQDYAQGRKYGNSSGPGAFGQSTGFGSGTSNAFGSTSAFGQPNTASNTGSSLFNSNPTNTTTNTGFGSSTTGFGFGNSNNNANTSGSSLFGQKPAGTGLFGTTTTTPSSNAFGFGANTSTNNNTGTAFGNTSNTSGTGLGGGGLFGAASSTNAGANAFGQQNKSPFSFGTGNNTATNTSTFGNTNNTNNTGSSLFGTSNASPFGAANNTNNTATSNTGFGFGAANNNNNSTPSTFGSFGSTAGANNNQAKPFGGFGSSTTATNSNPSPFGTTQTQNQTQNKPFSFGGFGQQQNTGTTNTTGSLFGGNQISNTTPNSTATASGSLFGAKPATTTGSLFGNNSTQNTTGGSLFGSKPAASTGTGSSLFGNNNSSSTGLGGSLFGNTNANQNQGQTQQTGTSLFGSNAQTLNTSGFGNTSNNSTLGGGSSLFGNNLNNNQQNTSFSQPLFQQQQQQPLQQQQNQQLQPSLQASIDANPYRFSPLFNSSAGNTSTSSSLGYSSPSIPAPIATPVSSNSAKKPVVLFPYKLTPRPTFAIRNRLNVRANSPFATNSTSTLASQVTPGGHSRSASLFDGVADEAILSTEAFSPRSDRRRLIIDRKTSENDVFSSKSPSSSPLTSSKSVDSFKREYRDNLHQRTLQKNQSRKAETPPVEASPPILSQSVITASKRANDINNESSGLTPTSDVPPSTSTISTLANEDSDEPPVATDAIEMDYGYWSNPTPAALRKMTISQLESVSDYKVGRNGFGQVSFNVPVNLTSFARLEQIPGQIVVFDRKECTVYPDDSKKPPVGQGLNVPATIFLEQCYPMDKETHNPIKDATHHRVKSHIERLKRIPETEFVTYIPESGTWIFKVKHFSRWALDDDDEDEDEEEEEEKKNPNQNNHGLKENGSNNVDVLEPMDTSESPYKVSLSGNSKPLQSSQNVDNQSFLVKGTFTRNFHPFNSSGSALSNSSDLYGVDDTFQYKQQHQSTKLSSVLEFSKLNLNKNANTKATENKLANTSNSLNYPSSTSMDESFSVSEVMPGGFSDQFNLVSEETNLNDQQNEHATINEDKQTIDNQNQNEYEITEDRLPVDEDEDDEDENDVENGSDDLDESDTSEESYLGISRLQKEYGSENPDINDNDSLMEGNFQSNLKDDSYKYFVHIRDSDSTNNWIQELSLCSKGNSIFDDLQSKTVDKNAKKYNDSIEDVEIFDLNEELFGKEKSIDLHNNVKSKYPHGAMAYWGPDNKLVAINNTSVGSKKFISNLNSNVCLIDYSEFNFKKENANKYEPLFLPELMSISSREDSLLSQILFLPTTNFKDFLPFLKEDPLRRRELCIWKLASILFDPLEEFYELSDKKLESFVRKNKLTKWLSEYITEKLKNKVIEDDLVFTYLLKHDITNASFQSIKDGNAHVAVVLPLLSSADEEVRRDALAQLKGWRDEDILSAIPKGIRRVYELLSGNTQESIWRKQSEKFNISFKLDWVISFALKLWYAVKPCDGIKAAVNAYIDAYKTDPCVSEPDSGSIIWKLLQLYCLVEESNDNSDNKKIIDEIEMCKRDVCKWGSVAGIGKYKYEIPWIFYQLLSERTNKALNNDFFICTALDYTREIEDLGSWTHAVSLLLTIPNNDVADHTLKEILGAHIYELESDIDDSEGQQFKKTVYSYLSDILKVPEEYLFEAAALYARYCNKYWDEVNLLVKAKLWDSANISILERTGPEAIVAGEYNKLESLLSKFEDVSPVLNWTTGGEIYLEYVRLVLRFGNNGCKAATDKNITSNETAIVLRLLSALSSIKCHDIVRKVAISQIAVFIGDFICTIPELFKTHSNDILKMVMSDTAEHHLTRKLREVRFGFFLQNLNPY